MTDLGELVYAQYRLQRDSYDADLRLYRGDERADSVIQNVIALEDELHEAMQEIKWKPWLTTGRGDWVDRDAFVKELVDAFHFFMNLLVLACDDGEEEPMDISALVDEFVARYFAKRQVNAKRQADGYDGTKDADGRATDEPELPWTAPETPASHAQDVVDRHLRLQADNAAREQE